MNRVGERVKIAATVGPASADPKILADMIDEGVDLVRVNASHVEPDTVAKWVKLIRKAGRAVDHDVAVMLDLQGIKRRIGDLPEPILLKEGAKAILSTRQGEGRIPAPIRSIKKHLKEGSNVFLDDGFLRLIVDSVGDREIECTVMRGGFLKARAGINLPGVPVHAKIPTKRDKEHIAAGVAAGVDMMAVSFVRTARDMWRCRELSNGIPLIAKIERPEAVANIDDIANASDGMMVARGDLAVETRPEELPVLQKSLVAAANRARKPVIVATEMLASMVYNPRPTRAELTDVGNAVLDGADATMLSNETAVGKDPVRAVRYMSRIIAAVERSLQVYDIEVPRPRGEAGTRPDWAIADAAVDIAQKVGAKAIVSITGSGRTARLVSAGRPSVPIFSFSTDPAVSRRVAVMWGVVADTMRPFKDAEKAIEHVLKKLRKKGHAAKGERVIVVFGSPIEGHGTKTNTVRIALT